MKELLDRTLGKPQEADLIECLDRLESALELRGAAEGVCGDPGSNTTNRSDLTEASTDMTVSQSSVNPTDIRKPSEDG